MEQLTISGKLQEIDKESISTCLISTYEKGEVFEEIEYCLDCGCMISFHSKLLKASGILIREIKSINSSCLTEGLEISGEPIIMRFLVKTDKENPTHNITYGSLSKTRFVTTYQETDSVFMIILSKEFYFNLIHHTPESHKAFAAHIFNDSTTNLFAKDLPINPMIQEIINEIKDCTREGVFKRIFIENKVQELLLLQLELYIHQKDNKNEIGLSEDDIGKLHHAKQILESNFTKAPTVKELSKEVFLNETKLRKGFKTYFDITIKSYVISLKMKFALELLQANNYNITEIADLCGYNGLVQFSSAFKKIYGCSPKKFKLKS